MIAGIFILSLLAWALLALGLPRHHAAWFGPAPAVARRRVFRVLGWSGLPLGWWLAVAGQGYELGSVLWAVLLMLSALAWALLMSLRESVRAGGGRTPVAAGARRGGRGRRRS